MIRQHAEACLRKSLDESSQSPAVRADDGIRQQNISDSARSEHLRRGQGSAFMLGDPRVHLQLDNLARLVRLGMRPKSSRTAGNLNGPSDVLANQILVKEEGGREYFRGIP